MRLDLKPDVTLDELSCLVNAMLNLRTQQRLLEHARRKNYRRAATDFESEVKSALDDLWEAQEACRGT